jgi:hypothetical protein
MPSFFGSYTNSQRQSVQGVERAACPESFRGACAAGYDGGQQRGPTVWNMCRLLSGNGITTDVSPLSHSLLQGRRL